MSPFHMIIFPTPQTYVLKLADDKIHEFPLSLAKHFSGNILQNNAEYKVSGAFRSENAWIHTVVGEIMVSGDILVQI